ncbi:MAG: two-component regulator propeller domain-containing protein [Segetibacter sp.]
MEDKHGNIWIHNWGFISVYHPLTGRINRIEIADDSWYPGSGNIQNFCKDEQGNIWIVTGENIYKYDSVKNKCITWLFVGRRPGADYRRPNNIIYDPNKKSLWLARESEILLIDIQSKKITRPFFTYHPGEADIPEAFTISTF